MKLERWRTEKYRRKKAKKKKGKLIAFNIRASRRCYSQTAAIFLTAVASPGRRAPFLWSCVCQASPPFSAGNTVLTLGPGFSTQSQWHPNEVLSRPVHMSVLLLGLTCFQSTALPVLSPQSQPRFDTDKILHQCLFDGWTPYLSSTYLKNPTLYLFKTCKDLENQVSYLFLSEGKLRLRSSSWMKEKMKARLADSMGPAMLSYRRKHSELHRQSTLRLGRIMRRRTENISRPY